MIKQQDFYNINITSKGSYFKYLKGNSAPPSSDTPKTLTVKTVSSDNRISRLTLLPPKTLSKDLDHVYFTFFKPTPSNIDVLKLCNDGTYSDENQIDFDMYLCVYLQNRDGL